jgi:SAM-dependent methyltransferase
MIPGERQVAPTLSGIRRDHVARYEFAAQRIGGHGQKVLDVACGIGYGAAILADAGHEVLGVERNAEAIQYGRQRYWRTNVVVIEADACVIQEMPADSHAAAVCFETIEHLEDPLPMLRALNVVAPLLIASVPNETVFPHGGRIKFHYRHYTRQAFADLLAQAGWEVTEWWGQAGPESEVERDIEGRTLIAVARRAGQAKPVPTPEPVRETLKVAPPEGVPDHVAIVGLGPSCATFFELTRGLGGISAYCDEVWGINAIGDVLRCDRVFHMDDMRIQEARAKERPDSNIARMVEWIRTHPGPVYTSVVREGYPGLVAFPLQDVLNGRYDTNGGAPYFNSTAAYAIAYAVHIGVKRISLFGLDYTMPNAHNAEKGRACCEFWLGIATARGIEVTVPETTSLLDAVESEAMRLYGYDCVEVSMRDTDAGVEVTFKDRAVIPTAAEIEARYDHARHPNKLMEK